MAKTKIDLLVEYISNDNYVAANQLLGSVLEDVQAKRVRILKEDNGLDFGDEDSSNNLEDGTEELASDDTNEEAGDEPSTEQQTDVADDIVETDSIMDEINDIEIKVNKRLILGLLNKLSELSVVLNNSDLDKNDTQFITFDETMNTFKKILQELQNQTTLAVDQKDVLSKIEILKTKVIDLENNMEQLRQGDSMDQLDDNKEDGLSDEETGDEGAGAGDEGAGDEGQDSEEQSSQDDENPSDEGSEQEGDENNGEEITL